MLYKEKVSQLCKNGIDGRIFTTDELNSSYFLSSSEITRLLNENIIERTAFRGTYELSKNKIAEVKQTQFLLSFLQKLNSKNFDEALRMIVESRQNGNLPNKKYNIYLLMLSFIADLPLDLAKRVKSFKIEDLVDKNDAYYNTIKHILAGDIEYAKDQFHIEIMRMENQDTPHNQTMRVLLYHALYGYKVNARKMITLIFSQNYFEAISFLESRATRRILNCEEQTILNLLYICMSIRDFRVIPQKREMSSRTREESIMSGQFDCAMQIFNGGKKKKKHFSLAQRNFKLCKVEREIVCQLLELITDMLDFIDTNREDEEIFICLPVEAIIAFYKTCYSFSSDSQETNRNALREYLDKQGKSKYLDIIIDLIISDIAFKDFSFYSSLKGLGIILNMDLTAEDIYEEISKEKTSRSPYSITPKE